MRLTLPSILLCSMLCAACERPPGTVPDDLTRPALVKDRPIATNADLAAAYADERRGRFGNAAKLCGVREALGQAVSAAMGC